MENKLTFLLSFQEDEGTGNVSHSMTINMVMHQYKRIKQHRRDKFHFFQFIMALIHPRLLKNTTSQQLDPFVHF